MMIRRILTALTVLALSCTAAYAQSGWSLYAYGGASAAAGENLIENISPSPDTYASPLAGAGISFAPGQLLRFNVGYEISKYKREQRLSEVATDGLAYRSLDALYNAACFTVDLDIAGLFRRKGEEGRLDAYLGTGFGEMFICGADYTIKMGQEVTAQGDPAEDNYTFKAWLRAHNEDVRHNSPYIPVVFSIEYDITQNLSLGIRAGLKCILNQNAASVPDRTGSAALLLRVNIPQN